ncbi:VPS16 [Cordylochernes scorpioides]|uniref:Vacuolar protein sorting-associated protein 16 homolog n=1 Tax=Cordylochernes scorpioides TaxID=51811 RepID=A0ABY6K2H8_9ARAC|nr:VPS16 [Cordylochernes scorpioides]
MEQQLPARMSLDVTGVFFTRHQLSAWKSGVINCLGFWAKGGLKVELFSMLWNCNFSPADYLIASGQNGGPIALIRNDKRGLRFAGMADQKQIIYIYSGSGTLISSFLWNSGPFLDFGWSTDEDLICVQENGTTLVYDIFGNFYFRVLECRFFTSQMGTGLAVLGSNYKIYYVTNINDPRRKLVEIPGLDGPPTCWEVVSGQDRELMFMVARDTKLYIYDPVERKCRTLTTLSRELLVERIPTNQRTLLQGSTTMPGGGSVEFNAPINSIVALAVSMNQQHLALLADTGALWIGSLDLQVWEWSRGWILAEHPAVELDGIRIISSLTHELLHCVPQAITDIFKIASLEPGALLMEASKEFRMKSPKADEYLRMVREKNQLELAVTQCIEAAGHELDPQRQKKLLRAASFGKCFLPEISPEPFVTTCRKLRVLNAIRVHTIGLPLTWTQLPRLEHLTIPKLVDRLVRLRHYYLAIKICHYLNIPESRGSSHVLSQWALYKVETCKTNNPGALAKEIADKLGHAPGISYSEIAAHARDLGNPNLAIKLLDYESRASEQVPLLAKLKQDHQAMEKAISSGDSDLGTDSFILLSLSISTVSSLTCVQMF